MEVKQSEEWEAVSMNILEIGIEQGIVKGREEGREEGTARINRLNLLLKEQGRIDDIFRAAEDVEYQKKLFKEFNL